MKVVHHNPCFSIEGCVHERGRGGKGKKKIISGKNAGLSTYSIAALSLGRLKESVHDVENRLGFMIQREYLAYLEKQTGDIYLDGDVYRFRYLVFILFYILFNFDYNAKGEIEG